MIELCFYDFKGKIITPCDEGYEEARQEWNRSIQKYPKVIAYCENNCDVIQAICCARKNNVDIRIRSGGHNYEGYSVGNKVLVIDISKMNKISINYCDDTVKIQGGVQNSQLYDFVSSRGYPFPGGSCPTVGVSGYALGGGWGYSSRYLGLGCDSLIEARLINYKGKLIVANDRVNSDLFWSLKGAGGGNFGVIVSLKFKLPKKVDKVTLAYLYYDNPLKETQIQIFNIWQQWINSVSHKINMRLSIYNSATEGKGIYGTAMFYGNPQEAKKLLEPFYNIGDVRVTLEYLTFLQAIKKIEEFYPEYELFKSTGRFVYRKYDSNQIGKMIDFINEDRPRGSVFTAVTLYGLGGRVKDKTKEETAFYYRKARYILGIQSVWEDNLFKPDNVKWVGDKFKYIYEVTDGSYVNFPYSELYDYGKEYYGENIYRLKKVKRIYDPLDVFNFPQSI